MNWAGHQCPGSKLKQAQASYKLSRLRFFRLYSPHCLTMRKMTFQHVLWKKTREDEAQRIIRDEMRFVLEPNEKWFKKNLQSHLLREGCNYPLYLAQPVFYDAMITGLYSSVDASLQSQCLKAFPCIEHIHDEPLSYEEFHAVMRFLAAKLKGSEKQIALEVTKSIERIKQLWQLDEQFFHQELPQFEAFIETTMNGLLHSDSIENAQLRSSDHIRRRLYMALTTSLLRKMNVRRAFEDEFESIPRILENMHQDHGVFCRFMRFCQERTPYFTFIASQAFWRTLETLRLEKRHASLEYRSPGVLNVNTPILQHSNTPT